MPALHVFIDTNILLNFYSFSDDKLEILDELIDLVNPGKLTIHLPKQVENELKRNRESKLQFAMTEFKNAKLAAGVPHHMRGTEAAKQYDEAIKSAEKAKKVLIANAVSLALSNQLEVDEKLARLFTKATRHPEDDGIYNLALARMNKGNPPGKPQSIGDRYIWETLLAHVPDGDLFIISKDGDYSSPLTMDKTSRPLAFLSDEWSEAKDGGKLTVFKTINEVVEYYKNLQTQPENIDAPPAEAHIEADTLEVVDDARMLPEAPVPGPTVENPAPVSPAIPAAQRAPIDEAILELVESGSFSTTHWAVAELNSYLSLLTKDDAERLFQAAIDNNQIHWIMSDEDVNDFYLSLFNNWVTEIDAELADEVIELLGLTPDPSEEELA
ncbi:PIN domain-containing protein [Pseudomonas putida]|uniref:PIN domain-containing protein n=1 Tax=Pseudomonas putida TaxID=303 RepID=UPI003D996A52